MPLSFAERLFGMTRLGMKVVVNRNDIVPAEISHPVLFQPLPSSAMDSTSTSDQQPGPRDRGSPLSDPRATSFASTIGGREIASN